MSEVTALAIVLDVVAVLVFGAVLVRLWVVLGKITAVVEQLRTAIEGRDSMLD